MDTRRPFEIFWREDAKPSLTSYYTQIIRPSVSCQKAGDACNGDTLSPGAAGADLVTNGGLKSFTIKSTTGSGAGVGWGSILLNTFSTSVGTDVVTTLDCEAYTGGVAQDTFCDATIVALRGPPSELEVGTYENWTSGQVYYQPQPPINSPPITLTGAPASVALCGLSGFSFPTTAPYWVSGIWAGIRSSSCAIMGPNTVSSYHHLALWGRGDATTYSPFDVGNTFVFPFEGYSAFVDVARLK